MGGSKKRDIAGMNIMAIPGLCSQRKTVNMNMIENCVLDHFNMNSQNIKEVLRSKCRETEYTHYRHIVFFFAYKYMKHLSTSDIGKFYCRDHATVVHAKNKILGMAKVYPKILESIARIDQRIKSFELPIPDELKLQDSMITKSDKKEILALTERISPGREINQTNPAKYKRGKKKGRGVSKWLDFIKNG